MKTIVIDGEVLGTDRMDGIHRFMIEVLSRIDELLPEKELKIHLIHRDSTKIKNLELKNIKDVPLSGINKAYRFITIPKYIKKVDGIYCSMSNDAVCCADSIFTIMDLIPLYPISKYPIKALARMKMTYRTMKKYGRRIVTISEESKKDIISKLGIESSAITVVGTGYEHMNDIVEVDDIQSAFEVAKKDEYYYAIGNQYPYKNFKWVREVAKRNPKSTFVVAGSKTNIEADLGKETSNLVYIGYVSDEENKSLMKNAKAFIHPSKLEGFGIPPLEALSLGTPILVARASCLPEIYGGCARYFDPDDYDVDIDLLMTQPVDDPKIVLDKYSWDNTARQWLDIFSKEADR